VQEPRPLGWAGLPPGPLEGLPRSGDGAVDVGGRREVDFGELGARRWLVELRHEAGR
jgi:hypothetical protein